MPCSPCLRISKHDAVHVVGTDLDLDMFLLPPWCACRYRFCKEIADGMVHLSERKFVHRDLAARNVLLATGMVAKVADFGLSRQVETEDNSNEYYKSHGGMVPVRWTAPEGLEQAKFSTASDVWSFGITCVEIFQDGLQPYVDVVSTSIIHYNITLLFSKMAAKIVM